MENWKFKDIIKAIAIGGLTFIILIFIFVGPEYCFEEGGILYYFMPLYALIIIALYLIYFIIKINNKRNEKKTDLYYRDIEKKYTPAIISYIFNMNIEERATILSSILDLHVKKYLNIEKVNNKYCINVIKNDTKKLFFHERYIIACLSNSKLIEFTKFSELVEFDCKKELLVKDNEWNVIPIIMCVLVVSTIIINIVLASYNVFSTNGLLFMATTLLPASIIYVLAKINKNYKRTLKGESLAKKAKGLKNFLKDYTLINEKDIDYTKITDRYLGFAIAINEAKNMEKLYIDNGQFLSKYIKFEDGGNYEGTN